MKDIVQNYWQEMFKDFVIKDSPEELSFCLPDFPQPLMSPRFSREGTPAQYDYLNVVSEKSDDGYFLHVFQKELHGLEEIHFVQIFMNGLISFQ